MRNPIALMLALFALPISVGAQTHPPSLSLAAAIARAQSASFAVRLSEADANAVAARSLGARAQLLPQISASGTTTRGGISQLGMPVAQQTYLSTSVSVPLFAPSDLASATAASRMARAGAFDLTAARNDAVYTTTQAYDRAQLADAIITARLSTLAYQKRRAADVDIRVNAGAAPRYQRSQARAAFAEASHMLEDAKAERDEAVADLEVLLDLPISPSLQLADPLNPMPLMGTVADFQRKAALQRPEVLSAQEQWLAARARLTAARDRYLPNIVGAAHTYAGSSTPDLGPRGYDVGITASVPLLDGGTRASASAEAKADADRAQVVLEQAQRSAERDVANAYREYEAAHHGLDLARVQATATADELRVAILRERNGKGIALETLAAINDDASARENVMRATARLNDSIAGLYHASAIDMPTTPSSLHS